MQSLLWEVQTTLGEPPGVYFPVLFLWGLVFLNILSFRAAGRSVRVHPGTAVLKGLDSSCESWNLGRRKRTTTTTAAKIY